MIVKVTILKVSYSTEMKAFIHNRDRSYQIVTDVDDVVDVMRGRDKAFFEAEVNGDELSIFDEEIKQEW